MGEPISLLHPRYRHGFAHVAIGCDTHGREIEMVAVELEGGNWLVFHAMTPPSAKTYNELGMGRKR